MAKASTPSGAAAALKVVLDAVQNTFGAAIVILVFFGLALVSLAAGLGNLGPELRGELIRLLVWIMVAVLGLLFLLRIIKPSGLGGPPHPETKDLQIKDSKIA